MFAIFVKRYRYLIWYFYLTTESDNLFHCVFSVRNINNDISMMSKKYCVHAKYISKEIDRFGKWKMSGKVNGTL